MPIERVSQQNYQIAFAKISALAHEPEAMQKAYGRLCHKFPVMVIRSGLLQTALFYDSKTGGDTPLNQAYARILNDFREIAVPDDNLTITEWATDNNTSTLDYLAATERVLAAAVYFKRLAVSILNVQNGSDSEEPVHA